MSVLIEVADYLVLQAQALREAAKGRLREVRLREADMLAAWATDLYKMNSAGTGQSQSWHT